MTNIAEDIAKRAMFEEEFKTIVETKNVFSEVATKLVASAKSIVSPFTTVGVAKAHTQECVVPISTLTVSNDELIIDRLLGNAITDCDEELSYAKFDITAMIRADLYASVMKKANLLAVSDFVAEASVVAGTKDLSTSDLVRDFLVGIAADNAQIVGLRSSVDGAMVRRAPRHGQAFLACGRTAYVNIVSKIAGVVSLSSLKSVEGQWIETPYGVFVINLGDSADNVKRLIWGTAGVPVMGYREDQVKVDMGEYRSTTLATATDLDIVATDPLLTKTWFMSAQTKAKNTIFSYNQALVSTQLML